MNCQALLNRYPVSESCRHDDFRNIGVVLHGSAAVNLVTEELPEMIIETVVNYTWYWIIQTYMYAIRDPRLNISHPFCSFTK